MKYLYNIKNHFYISLNLFVLFASIFLTSFLEKQHLVKIEESFSSIFDDRLIPATDIFYIANQLYNRRLKLQSYVYAPEKADVTSLNLVIKNHVVDSLLQKYQKTYLIKNEVMYITSFLKKWKAYKAREEVILDLTCREKREGAIKILNSTEMLFGSMIADLQFLENIQSEVGENLTKTSKSRIASTNSLFFLQFGITIIVALVCNGLLFAGKVMRQPNGNFRLN